MKWSLFCYDKATRAADLENWEVVNKFYHVIEIIEFGWLVENIPGKFYWKMRESKQLNWGRESDMMKEIRNMKWIFIWRNVKNQDSSQAEVRASHFAIIFFQSIATKSTRKLTKSTYQIRIYDVNRLSTSKNKKVSETFGTEILYVHTFHSIFRNIWFESWF